MGNAHHFTLFVKWNEYKTHLPRDVGDIVRSFQGTSHSDLNKMHRGMRPEATSIKRLTARG